MTFRDLMADMSDDSIDRIEGCDPQLSSKQLEDVMPKSVVTETDRFAALANETRYRILLLADAADGGVCGCELEPHLDVKQSSISQSLSRLRTSGLLSRRKEGRWRYYDTTAAAESLLGAIDEERSEPLTA